MGKRKEDDNEELRESARLRPSLIRDKDKRSEMMVKYRKQKMKEKKKRLKERNKSEEEAIAIGEAPPPRQIPRTVENTREKDETMVEPGDEEIFEDEATDEFSAHFNREQSPKVLITTNRNPHKVVYPFIRELLAVVPDGIYYKRSGYRIKDIVKYATNGGFTAMIVLNENRKNINGMLVISLPEGPTAHFRVSNVVLRKQIKGHGRPTHHKPELILNNFDTRLGHRVGRIFASLFPQDPNFRGRRSITFHNQRDFIFFRHHRYIFETTDQPEDKKKALKAGTKSRAKKEKPPIIARLQECGPRFTLKLQSLQKGTFDTKHGEYEWVRKASLGNGRKQFYL